MIRCPSLFLLGVLLLGGCQEVTIVDDVDIALDWNPITGPSDALHSPYVQGASFALWVRTTKKQSLRGWRIESGDAGVLAVATPALSKDEEQLSIGATAQNAGSAELRVLDSAGEVRHTHTIEVRFPDRVDVLPHGPLLIGRDNVTSEEHPLVLHDGTATFLVQYYAGGDQLSGHGALSAVASTDIDAHAEKTSFLEDRDWLVIDAAQADVTQEIGLTVAGTMARTLPVDTLAEAEIDHMQLDGESEAHAHNAEWLVVLAEAFSAANRPIHGVEFAFTANGTTQQGFGDLYRYKYDDKLPVMLEATHGLHADGVMIHSAGGFVDSTNRLGCDSVPGQASPSGVLSALALLAGLCLWRRRLRT